MPDQFEDPQPPDLPEQERPVSRAEKIIGYTILILITIGFLLFFSRLLPHFNSNAHFYLCRLCGEPPVFDGQNG